MAVVLYLGSPLANGQHHDNGIRHIIACIVAILILLPVLLGGKHRKSLPRLLSQIICVVFLLDLVVTTIRLPDLKQDQADFNEAVETAKGNARLRHSQQLMPKDE